MNPVNFFFNAVKDTYFPSSKDEKTVALERETDSTHTTLLTLFCVGHHDDLYRDYFNAVCSASTPEQQKQVQDTFLKLYYERIANTPSSSSHEVDNSLNINGVEYFSTRGACLDNFNKKSTEDKIMSFIASCGNLLSFGLNKGYMIAKGFEKQMEPYTLAPNSNSANKKLVVCLHGLGSSPLQFKNIVDEMNQKNVSNIDIYIPKILQKGNAKLDEIVAPILKDIAEWAHSGEDKELVLVGISNGGRIARAIEAELINSGNLGKIQKLRFVSIVGASKGSSMVTLAKKVHAAPWVVSKNIAEEMPTDSERFKQLDIDSNKAREVTTLQREYTFIAAPHDWFVPNYDSTLMDIPNAKVKYSLVPNHGHVSIVNAVASSVANIILEN